MSKNDIAPKKVRSALGEKSYQTRRRKRVFAAAQASKAAYDYIGDIYPGFELYAVVAGQFSYIDLIQELVRQINEPFDLTVSTWTMASYDLGIILSYLENGQATRIRFLTDRSFQTRQPGVYASLLEALGEQNVRRARAHCKFVSIQSANWNLVIRSSANMNANRRLENYEVSDDPALAAYMTAIVDEIFMTPPEKNTGGRRELKSLKTVWGNPDPEAIPKAAEADPLSFGKILNDGRTLRDLL